MNPPPAEGLASRLFLGPALRTQPDRRLVTLVRDGYDTAFEEIVRRYGKALTRYAAAIVGGRSEDVTQDAFSKALLGPAPGLRRRDRPAGRGSTASSATPRSTTCATGRRRAVELNEALGAGSGVGGRGGRAPRGGCRADAGACATCPSSRGPRSSSCASLKALAMRRSPRRSGLSGGGARQAIYRARQALRDGLGLMIPLPLLRMLIDHGAEAHRSAPPRRAPAARQWRPAGAGGRRPPSKWASSPPCLAGSVGTGLALKEECSP